MPRPSWSGFLRLSLVSCPVFLAPATTERETIRLHQINPATGNRIKLQPVDAESGEALERSALVKGYEIEKGRFVILGPEELAALKIESTRVLELTEFVARGEINPIFLDTPYYLYPDGENSAQAYHVIAAALAAREAVGLGRITMQAREHPVAVQPFGQGLMMNMLRTAAEVRDASFEAPPKSDPAMIELAETIIDKMAGAWEPAAFTDRYQDALRELIAAKAKGIKRKPAAAQPEAATNVIDLMAVLKRSLAEQAAKPAAKKLKKRAPSGQRSLLLPVAGGGKASPPAAAEKKPRKRA